MHFMTYTFSIETPLASTKKHTCVLFIHLDNSIYSGGTTFSVVLSLVTKFALTAS